jgi:hypothetical protein
LFIFPFVQSLGEGLGDGARGLRASVPRHRRDPVHRRDVSPQPAGLAGGDRGLRPRQALRTFALIANTMLNGVLALAGVFAVAKIAFTV